MAGHSSQLVKKMFLMVALASAACSGHDIHESAAPDAAYDLSELEAIAKRFVNDEWARGIAVALVKGERVEIRGYGMATEDGATPDAHTLFEIGSVTKVFTALTLATMVSDGVVELEQPVEELLPATAHVPDHEGKKITLLTLATHSSNLPVFRSFDTEWEADWLYSFLSGHALARDPGEQFEYSSLGMGLLGHALSVRAQKPYADIVRERVLVPLGMNHTYVGTIPEGERLADGHDVEGAPVPIPAWGSAVLAPAIAISSDAADMAAFVHANLRPPPALRAAILSTQAEYLSRPGGKIGLGWHIGFEGAPGAHWHNGQTNGYHAFVALDVEKQVGVVVLANTATRAVDWLGRALFRMLHGEPPDLGLPRLVAVSREELDRCTGRYEIEPGFELTITRESGALFAQITEGAKYRVYPSSETTFHYRVDDASLDFEMGVDGRAKRVLIQTSDETAPADRIE